MSFQRNDPADEGRKKNPFAVEKNLYPTDDDLLLAYTRREKRITSILYIVYPSFSLPTTAGDPQFRSMVLVIIRKGFHHAGQPKKKKI